MHTGYNIYNVQNILAIFFMQFLILFHYKHIIKCFFKYVMVMKAQPSKMGIWNIGKIDGRKSLI